MGIDFYISRKQPYTSQEMAFIISTVSGVPVKPHHIGRQRRLHAKMVRQSYHQPYILRGPKVEARVDNYYKKIFADPALDVCSVMASYDNHSLCIGRRYEIPEGKEQYGGSTKDPTEIYFLLWSKLRREVVRELLPYIDYMHWG